MLKGQFRFSFSSIHAASQTDWKKLNISVISIVCIKYCKRSYSYYRSNLARLGSARSLLTDLLQSCQHWLLVSCANPAGVKSISSSADWSKVSVLWAPSWDCPACLPSELWTSFSLLIPKVFCLLFPHGDLVTLFPFTLPVFPGFVCIPAVPWESCRTIAYGVLRGWGGVLDDGATSAQGETPHLAGRQAGLVFAVHP